MPADLPCDRTRRLAQRVLAGPAGGLQPRDLSQLEHLLLDYCGVTLGGADRPWVAALHRHAQAFRGSGAAQVIGSDLRVAAAVAALANGAAAHSFELDDTHDGSMSHPGSVVISAALAVGAECGSPAGQVLAAVVAGYEAVARIGRAARASRVIAAGFHPTPLFGVFGAAAAAAVLYRLDADALCRAWGHALSLTAGSMQFSQEEAGAEVKRMHAGYGAHNGVLACQFARAGIEAPHRALDGRYGFLVLYGQSPDAAALEAEGPLAIHEISLKPYACCRLLHSMIDGLRTVTDGFSIGFDDVRSIRVTGPSKLPQQHVLPRPATPMAAQYSLPYTVGATLEFGPQRFDAFEARNLDRPEILRWADKVEVGEHPECERVYPEQFGTCTELTLASGEVRTALVLDSKGTPAFPMSLDEIAGKAAGLVRAVAPGFDLDALRRAVAAFRGDATVASLDRCLARAPGAARPQQT